MRDQGAVSSRLEVNQINTVIRSNREDAVARCNKPLDCYHCGEAMVAETFWDPVEILAVNSKCSIEDMVHREWLPPMCSK